MRRILAFLTALLLCSFAPCAGASQTVSQEKNASLGIFRYLYEGESQNTLVFSPLSLTLALGMAAEGAQEETLAQLQTITGDDLPDPLVIEDLLFSGAEIANTAFLRQDFQLLTDYEKALKHRFAAEPLLMEAGNVKNQVNDWVFTNTNGLIDGLLEQEPGPDTMMLLISALSMQADWVHPFNPDQTSFSVFHAPAGEIEVSSMNQTNTFRYREKDGVQSIVLPYKHSALEMLVLLPDNGDLQHLVDELSDSPDAFLARYTPDKDALVQLSLPNIQAESSFELKEVLSLMGVCDPFDPNRADFSRMTENALDMDLHIGSVLQKAVLKVYETGTEAAAATQIAMLARGAYPADPVSMNMDSPFLLLIHDSASGYILFAACINNPA